MKQKVLQFIRSEQGAVTVDWVVLTAAVVALGVAAGSSVTTGSKNLSDGVWEYTKTIEPGNIASN